MKNNKILKIKYELINKQMKAAFILDLLKQPLHSILSKDSNENCNKTNSEKIKYILEKYEKTGSNIIGFLSLKYEDCLSIFLDTKIDIYHKFKYKICDFIEDEYNNYNPPKNLYYKDEIYKQRKDYIASLILAAYNFKRIFLIKANEI